MRNKMVTGILISTHSDIMVICVTISLRNTENRC